ncbi:MAG: Uncharacterised protein [Flavobacteriaceae bacterium]|nr:MAG: Uncharacterised protein [Flavobacteriaceae bacterium]
MCVWPSISSIPFKEVISGSMYFNSPHLSNKINPLDGLSVSNILFNSTIILSFVIISILEDKLRIELRDSSLILKPSLVAKRIALSILRGSSLYVTSGSRGVLIILF